jgi:hypothetical protein
MMMNQFMEEEAIVVVDEDEHFKIHATLLQWEPGELNTAP